MERKLKLVFGIHIHQPAGNFIEVFENNYKKSYLPFFKLLGKFPSIKLVFHSSGILLKYLLEKEEFLNILSKLVDNNRIEILTGGFFEPIFPAIFEKDRALQIEKLSELIRKKLNYDPDGIWLAERVWEPHIISSLKKSGVNYILLDDYHILSSGISREKLDGYYITEDVDDYIGVFPIDERMRYLTPWAVVDEVEKYLKNQFERGRNLIVVVDDGEKFGGWPETYKWVYEEKWLEKFFNMIEKNSDWLESTTLKSYFNENDYRDKIIIPPNSYIEMGEWALPPESAVQYGELKNRLKNEGIYEENKIFLKGTLWRNFLIKYNESNILNKVGTFLSKELDKSGKYDDEALNSLLESQCNDVYWHGVFGGIYLPHLRENAYRKFKDVFKVLEGYWKETGFSPGVKKYDIDLDSKEELLINCSEYFLIFKPDICEIPLFYLKSSGLNVFDVIMRYRERYHIKKLEQGAVLLDDGKKLEIPELMGFDIRPRWGNRKFLVNDPLSPEKLVKGDFSSEEILYRSNTIYEDETSFKVESEGDKLIEVIKFLKNKPSFETNVKNLTEKIVTISFDISTLTHRDIEKWISLDGGDRFGVGEQRFCEKIKKIEVVDKRRSFKVSIESDSDFSLSIYPIFTYSLDVDKIESTFQGTCLTLFFNKYDFSYKFLVERI